MDMISRSIGPDAAPGRRLSLLDDLQASDRLPSNQVRYLSGVSAIVRGRWIQSLRPDQLPPTLDEQARRLSVSKNPNRNPTAAKSSSVVLFPQQPALQLIYDTAPTGRACLSPDCRYLQINQRLTEICGISVEDHLGRSVRDCVPALAEAVEGIVRSILKTGEPVIGIEVAGQRADQAGERFWITYWHPLRSPSGEIVGVNVAAEEITERKRAEAALQESEREIRSAKDAAEAALRNLRETQDSLIEAEKLAAWATGGGRSP
jgi:PAS domain S-box-containing protein